MIEPSIVLSLLARMESIITALENALRDRDQRIAELENERGPNPS